MKHFESRLFRNNISVRILIKQAEFSRNLRLLTIGNKRNIMRTLLLRQTKIIVHHKLLVKS